MTTPEEEHRQRVEARKAYGRWLQTQVKCVYCLAHTERFAPTLGLPFCQDDHFQRYARGEHSYFLSRAQEQLSKATEEFRFIDQHYLQGNQEGLFRAHDELHRLRERTIDQSIDYKLSVARYHAYELEVPMRLDKPQELDVQRELLHVIARLVASLETCIQQTDTLTLQIDEELQQLPQLT